MFNRQKKEPVNTTEKVLELLQPVRYKPSSVDEMAEVNWFYANLINDCLVNVDSVKAFNSETGSDFKNRIKRQHNNAMHLKGNWLYGLFQSFMDSLQQD